MKHKYTHKHALQIENSRASKTTDDELFSQSLFFVGFFFFFLHTHSWETKKKTLQGEGVECDLHA